MFYSESLLRTQTKPTHVLSAPWETINNLQFLLVVCITSFQSSCKSHMALGRLSLNIFCSFPNYPSELSVTGSVLTFAPVVHQAAVCSLFVGERSKCSLNLNCSCSTRALRTTEQSPGSAAFVACCHKLSLMGTYDIAWTNKNMKTLLCVCGSIHIMQHWS